MKVFVCVALTALGACVTALGAENKQFWTAEDYFNEAVAAYSSSTNVETSIIARRNIRRADSNDCPRVEVPAGDAKRIRWIGAPGLRNVRDIGGWTGLRAGRVYRGSALMWAEQSNVAYAVESPVTRDVLVNRLGIRAELDLRGEKERKVTKDGVPRHGLPEFGIRPVCVPLGGYMDAFKGTNAYRRAMQTFADPANFPIYVHCAGGADRTGTVIFLLEALCGVPEWQMDIDYEITSMASVFGRRDRTDTGMLCYKSFKDALKELYAGTTVNEKVEDYCRRTLGLTDGEIRSVRRNLQRPRETVPGFVLVEAEDFDDFGRWRLDTQFTHKMGSAYLIAPGVGEPIGAAKTSVNIPQNDLWHAWVRTKDWLPEFSPGRFVLSVGGRRGRPLGASRHVGWLWERAGSFALERGQTPLALEDLSGAFARCDAVILTTDANYVPPDDAEALRKERLRLRGESDVVTDSGVYDVVVVGAGPAGVPAAIAAARGGAKVALVGDRPVLGGNASDEIGVNMCGAAITHMTARETGLAEEAVCERTRHPGPGMSNPYRVLAEGEKNLTVFYNERVTEARAEGGRVLSVDCRNTLTGARSRLAGRLFVDATGDGWLGYFAGAEYREGRESRKEFGETCAPDEPDKLTMSGLLHEPGIGVCYRAEETDGPVAYQTPRWARVLPEGFERPIFNLRGQWWIEHSGLFDDCADPERARDELIRISFAYWGWLKNESKLRDKARNFRLEEIPVLTGRREARRLVGDYILTEHDCLQARVFPDAVAYGGWPLDTHDPMGMSAPKSDGYWKHHPDVPIYTIPYRCLYSKNIANLFMAGRDISGTHIAMGSARVQQTCSVVGQAVGTAAALCLRYGLSPRELGQTRIGELQQQLMRDDAYIPGFANADPLDLARSATVSASSSVGSYARPTPCARRYNIKGGNVVYTNATPAAVIDGVARGVNGEAHAWVSGPGLPQWIRLDFPKMITAGEVRLTFDTNLEPRALPRPTDPALVRAYDLEGTEDGTTWFPLATEEDNYRRLCVHRFAPRRVKAIRLTVRKTYGAQQAFVNEIRVYAGGRAAWMRGGVGIMVHWLFPSYRDVDRWTDKFDVAAFLRDFRETGADWLVFTSGQCRGAYASPNEAFVRQCGEGHTPRRDLLLEIARGVKAMGKRFIVYSAVDFVKDGCDDHSMQRGLCWDNNGVDRREFERRWGEVLGEWSLRLGNLCDGWWLDGCSEVQYPQGVTWPLWLDRCRAGNPLAAVAFNGGANRFAGKWGPSDYTAGETASLISAEEVVGKVADEPDCQRHYLFPLDGYWGGFWAWPKGAWARTEELQCTRPELFDQKHLDEMLAKREFPHPIYTPERLKRFLLKARQAGSAVTINVGISPEGRLNPLSMKLVSSAKR